MSRHYIPVGAKREALRMYRDRRRHGEGPWHERPLNPMDAMDSVVRFYEGHLAAAVAYDYDKHLKRMIDGFRAADYYRGRMYQKPWRNSGRDVFRQRPVPA